MIQPEKPPIFIAENTVVDRYVITNKDANMVQIESTPLSDDVTRYVVTGRLPLERQAIAGIMGAPLGHEAASWQEVRDGLREISYPHRKIRALAHGAVQRAHLNEIAPAARELAQALTDNQDQRTQTATMPVFDFIQSYRYVTEEVRRRTSTRKLATYLKGIGMDFAKVQGFYELISADETDPAAALELERLLGFDEEDSLDIQNSALLAEAGGAIEAELLYRIKSLSFVGFKTIASYSPEGIVGGGSDVELYIRNQDVPENLHGMLDSTKVAIQKMMRDGDKKTGVYRARVSFSTQEPRVVVHPQIVWENHDGKRILKFPSNGYRKPSDWKHLDRPERPSSILGASLVADFLAAEKGIDYKAELAKRQQRAHKHKGRRTQPSITAEAGLLPIVLDHRQQQLLDDDYFSAIEDIAK